MSEYEQCELCKRWAHLEEHHVYGGPNRKISDKWGMVARLCPSCHRTGKGNVTDDYAESLKLKKKYQAIFEERYPDLSFLKIFGRSYL